MEDTGALVCADEFVDSSWWYRLAVARGEMSIEVLQPKSFAAYHELFEKRILAMEG